MKTFKRLKALAIVSMLALAGLQMTASAAEPVGDNGVEKEKVWFDKSTDDIKLAGEMYLPKDFNENNKYQSIVVVHPGGGVKEQTAGIYAQKLAEKGFVTLAFDAAYQGESEGTPRHLEDPESRTEDIRSAVDYLTTRKFVDRDNIGALGICAGGGYTVHAAETEARIKAVATVSAVDSGRTRREGLGGTMTDESRNEMLRQIGEQRTIEANGGPVKYIHYVPNSPEEIPQGKNSDAFREYYEYYRTPRGQHPRSENIYRFTSLDRMFGYTGFDHVDWISPRPLLMIVGSNAASKYLSEDAYKMAREPKELYVIPGATHIDLYDREQYVNPAVDKLSDFFHQYLK